MRDRSSDRRDLYPSIFDDVDCETGAVKEVHADEWRAFGFVDSYPRTSRSFQRRDFDATVRNGIDNET